MTDVQAALYTISVPLLSTTRTRLRRISLAHYNYGDAFDFRLVREQVCEAVERPPVQAFIATVAPIPGFASLAISTNTFEVADSNCPDTTFNTLCNNVFRDGV